MPLSAILTSASLHDSQVAIPLATMTAARVTNLYDLMDGAYDAREIHTVSERHIPIIATNPRRDKALKDDLNREARAQRAAGYPDARTLRYRIRSVVERTNARLKDEFGARPGAGTHESRLPSDVRLARTHGRSDHPPRWLIAPANQIKRSHAVSPNGRGSKTLVSKLPADPARTLSDTLVAPKTSLAGPTEPITAAVITQAGNSARGSTV